MKILYIATSFERNDSRIYYKQAMTLAKLGHSITILCSDQKQREVHGNIAVISTKKSLSSRINRFLFSKKSILEAIKDVDFDIVQINSPENLLLVKKIKKMGKKVIFDSREDYSAYISEKKWIPYVFRKLTSKIYGFYEMKKIKMVDAIITVTPYLSEKFKKIHKNVHLITNYPILNNYIKNSRAIATGDLCFYGNTSSDDMHLNILKAISHIPNARYHLLFGNPGKHTNMILKAAKKLHISDRVFIYGRIPFEEIPNFLKKASIGIILRRYAANYGYTRGSLGVIKFFDYMANGLPVICTDFDEWKKIIDEYHCGIYVNPYNIDAIQSAIEELVNFPQKAKTMGENARKAAEEKFNWGTQEKPYSDIFVNLENQI